MQLREVPGLPPDDVSPPVVAEAGDPFAELRIVHLLARLPRGEAIRVRDVELDGLLAARVARSFARLDRSAAREQLLQAVARKLSGEPRVAPHEEPPFPGDDAPPPYPGVVARRVRFGLPKLADPRRAKWILLEVDGRTFGLAVDRVTDVFGTGGAEIRRAPALGGGDDVRGISGVTTYDGALTFVLDVSRFGILIEPLLMAGLVGKGATIS